MLCNALFFYRFRHPNIIELLGFSEGPGLMCLIYNYMDNRSLEDQLHNVTHIHTGRRRSAIAS